MADSLVSIVIPTYKRPIMLRRTIESVLNQTYMNIEVIIVDDNDSGSRDREETEDLIRKYCNNEKVNYLKHQFNRNGAAARNTGIHAARGKYIAFLDDDDEFLPEKIEKQVKRIEGFAESDIGGVYCNYERYTCGEFSLRTSHKYNKDEGDLTADLLMERNEIGAGSTLLIKKSVAEELGGFDEHFQRHQDWEFLLRFFKKYKLALCEEVLVKVHSEDGVNKKTPAQMATVKKKYLEQFQYEISSLNTRTQKRIYSRHWLVVAEGFYQAGDRINGDFYSKKARGYGGLPVKGKVKLYAYHFNLFGMLNSIFLSGKKILLNKERK